MTNSSHRHLTVHISPKSVVVTLLILLAAVVMFILRDLLLAVLAAVVVAAAVEPAVRRLKNWRMSRLPAVLSIYLLTAAAVITLFVFLLNPLVQQAINFLNQLPSYLAAVDNWSPSETGLVSQAGELFGTEGQFSIQEVTSEVRGTLANISDSLLSTLVAVFGGVLNLVLIVILSLYMAAQDNGVAKFLSRITPIRHQQYVLDLWRRSQQKIGLWVRGQLILMLVIGVLTYVGLIVLGVKHALLLSVLAAFAELVPLFGPFIAAIPAVLIALGGQGWAMALIVAVFYIAIQQLENYLIYPTVVQKVVGLSPIVVIIALIVGWQLAGFLGMLLSVPLAAVLLETFNDFSRSGATEASAAPDQDQ